jgi:phosphoribosylamine--glycine ligase
VLEFNVRFGDPETQPVLMRLKSDLYEVLEAACDGRLESVAMDWSEQAAVCVVMAAGGYPGSYEKGKVIHGIAEASAIPDVTVFHAGTSFKDGQVVSSGGRVLGVTALGPTISAAIERAYKGVLKITWEGMQYRRDIGARAVRHLASRVNS